MGMTSKEKSKRYRERLKENPEKLAERKRKKRESYHKNKKLIANLKPQEKVNCRIIWKLRKQEQRKRKKAIHNLIANTPPSSPSILHQEPIDHPLLVPTPPDSPTVRLDSANKIRGRKRMRRDRTNLYRQNKRLKEENDKLQKKYEKYKKRAQRNKNKSKKTNNESTEKINSTQDEQNKYKLLSNAIKDRYRRVHNNKEKIFLKNIFRELKTSEKKTIIKETLGLEGNIRTCAKDQRHDTGLKKKISVFFNRDDISRNTAGKKETVGRGNKKMQKRVLLDSMLNLYKSFKLENPGVNCSYFYFTKNRPYYVVRPTVDGREMCLCKTHTNAAYKAKALRNKKALETFDLSSHIKETVCDSKSKYCMFGTCMECKDKKIKVNMDNINGKIQWFEWVREEEIYTKEGKNTKAIKNVKKLKENTIKNLISSFEEDLKVLKKHVFNLKNQYKSFRQCVDDIQPNEAVVLVDFSENYNAKCTEEIQAHHFGGSRQQVTLHTVVVYVKSGENNHKALSFCTVSPCNIHQPAAIWAHLHPILINIRANYPAINKIHFFSDGPFSQYRQKVNFFLSCTKTFDYGFEAFTWSYFEAGHGKGPADGIGGYLKRAADNLVATGTDITNASEFYHALEGKSKVKMFFVRKEEIETIMNQIPKNIVPLVGTIHVHQVFSMIPGQLKFRNLSCFCTRGICECLNPKVYHPIPVPKKNTPAPPTACDENSSDDNVPLSHMLKRKDISFEDLRTTVSKNMYKCVYDSSDTSDDDIDGEKRSLSKQINYNGAQSNNLPNSGFPEARDNDDQQPSTLGHNSNIPLLEAYELEQQSTSVQKNNLTGLDLSEDENEQQSTSEEQNNLSKLDLPGLRDYENEQQCTSGQQSNSPKLDLPSPGDYEDQQPSTSGQKNYLPGPGDYLLVKVYGAKGKSYRYVCVAQSDMEDDGEIKVTFLKAVKRGKLFVLNQKDVSYIAYEDVIKKLPNPDAEYKRGEVYYKFSSDVDIFEK